MCSRKCQGEQSERWRGGKYLSVPVTSLTVRIKPGVLTIHRAHDPQRTSVESRACTSKRNITNMKFCSFLLSSLLLSFLLAPPPVSSAGRPRTPQPAQTLLRVATGADITTGRLLGFGVPRLFLGRMPREEEERTDDDDDDQELEEIRNDEEPVKFKTRREYAPLSIDLTFHLLRNMIHNARTEEQRLQAQVNQKLLDEVGK
ncbi:urotensin 1 [Hippocampus zosterae]|uniref:urotensin 1 n=1 Tax=Hippocampus zosterae TaxID=109293 RepID=UPI00223D1AEB|nr:urotensin 1 [Hippocampus zosterae]